MVLAVAWGAVVVYRGVTEGLPASPQHGRAWGSVAAFGVAIAMVLLGVASLWQALQQGHMRLGGGFTLLAVLLAVAGTAGMMRWRGRPASECAAAVDHMRALTAAEDRNGITTARVDNQRAVLIQRCEADPDATQRRCVLAARSMAEVDACAR